MNHNREDLLLVSDVTCKEALTVGASTRRGKKMRPVAKVCKGSGFSNKSFREGRGRSARPAAQMKARTQEMMQ